MKITEESSPKIKMPENNQKESPISEHSIHMASIELNSPPPLSTPSNSTEDNLLENTESSKDKSLIYSSENHSSTLKLHLPPNSALTNWDSLIDCVADMLNSNNPDNQLDSECSKTKFCNKTKFSLANTGTITLQDRVLPATTWANFIHRFVDWLNSNNPNIDLDSENVSTTQMICRKLETEMGRMPEENSDIDSNTSTIDKVLPAISWDSFINQFADWFNSNNPNTDLYSQNVSIAQDNTEMICLDPKTKMGRMPENSDMIIMAQPSTDTAHECHNHNGSKQESTKSETTGKGKAFKGCKCTKSNCLKLYCDCFKEDCYCGEWCSCQNCHNQDQESYHVELMVAIDQVLSRDPSAFSRKLILDLNKPPSSARHRKGCNCKKSGCNKEYCECYKAGVGCSTYCKCLGCNNSLNDKEDNAEPSDVEAIDARTQIESSASARHSKGCKCKSSGCNNRYCECYKAGIGCSTNCKCLGCNNSFGKRKNDIPDNVEVFWI